MRSAIKPTASLSCLFDSSEIVHIFCNQQLFHNLRSTPNKLTQGLGETNAVRITALHKTHIRHTHTQFIGRWLEEVRLRSFSK